MLHSREDATVIPPPISHDDQTKEAQQADECCLMAELSITRAGRHYFYDGYRYARLSDAVAYAQVAQGCAHGAHPAMP